jgi:hypothetical protein
MIYFGNAQGDITKIISEPIYQGSNNASDIVFIAPFSNVTVCVAFVLPNGFVSTLNIMNNEAVGNMSEISLQDCDLKNNNGTSYNAWRYLVDRSLTEYAGVVKVQFYVFAGSNTILSTYTATFNVLKGVRPAIPVAQDEDPFYEKLYGRITAIEQNINTGIVRTIRLVGDRGTLPDSDAELLINHYPNIIININDVYTALPESKLDNKYTFQDVEVGQDEAGAYVGKLFVTISLNANTQKYDWVFEEEYEDIMMKENVTLPELQALLIPDDIPDNVAKNAAKMVVIQPKNTLNQLNLSENQIKIIKLVCDDFFIINASGNIERTKQVIVDNSIHNVNVQINQTDAKIIEEVVSLATGGKSNYDFSDILTDTYFNFYIYK